MHRLQKQVHNPSTTYQMVFPIFGPYLLNIFVGDLPQQLLTMHAAACSEFYMHCNTWFWFPGCACAEFRLGRLGIIHLSLALECQEILGTSTSCQMCVAGGLMQKAQGGFGCRYPSFCTDRRGL